MLSLLACKPKPSVSTGAGSAPVTNATPTISLAGIETRDRDLVDDEALVRINIAKRIMGLNPKSEDRHDHIGLSNVAELMGFDLPFNDCGKPWIVSQANDQVSITSLHNRGIGLNCEVKDQAAPVNYGFRRWILEPEAVVSLPIRELPQQQEWPKPFANSNANTASATAATINEVGVLKFTIKETAVASVTASGDMLSHRVSYERSVPVDPAYIKGWRPASEGLQILPGAGGGATFSFGQATSSSRQLARVSCTANVLQPLGCHYRVVLNVEHEIQQQKFRAMINLYPHIVELTGRLRTGSRCLRKPNIDGKVICPSDQNSDSGIVSETFGKDGDLDFIDDLTEQVAGGRGHWFWDQMRSLPLAQKDGIPTLDWALRYFAGQDFGGLSYDFLRTTESVSSCVLRVEVLPDSVGSCASLQDGAVVEPNIAPIL